MLLFVSLQMKPCYITYQISASLRTMCKWRGVTRGGGQLSHRVPCTWQLLWLVVEMGTKWVPFCTNGLINTFLNLYSISDATGSFQSGLGSIGKESPYIESSKLVGVVTGNISTKRLKLPSVQASGTTGSSWNQKKKKNSPWVIIDL